MVAIRHAECLRTAPGQVQTSNCSPDNVCYGAESSRGMSAFPEASVVVRAIERLGRRRMAKAVRSMKKPSRESLGKDARAGLKELKPNRPEASNKDGRATPQHRPK